MSRLIIYSTSPAKKEKVKIITLLAKNEGNKENYHPRFCLLIESCKCVNGFCSLRAEAIFLYFTGIIAIIKECQCCAQLSSVGIEQSCFWATKLLPSSSIKGIVSSSKIFLSRPR